MPFGCDRSSSQCPDNTIYGRTWTCFDRTMSGVWALYSPLLLSLLLAAGLVIPVTNAGCERVFSCQNHIMTKLQNRLSEEKIDCLMLISLEGPPMYQFNFELAFCK